MMTRFRHAQAIWQTLAILLTTATITTAAPPAQIDFAREVRPILSRHCFACHGPDGQNRRAGLRLDQPRSLTKVLDIADPDASEMLRRITSTDADVVMPPTHTRKPLSPAKIETLRRWIATGGRVTRHWAFAPIRSGATTGPRPLHHTIDHHIDAAIAREGLSTNPPSDPASLLRRVHLDLTGLPPRRDVIDRYLADTDPNRYQRIVDKLLDAPEFGQHVGRHWLDLVRYADTHGLHLDNYRQMWPYRDWVIDAINDNLPYDQFITRQLAGDLLPGATDGDRIASGFNRLNVTTNEDGSIYDEVFARNCIDRTNAVGTVMLGLTTQCAVCHDHKFDPISQTDYYSLLAFFNSLDGRAMDGDDRRHRPSMRVFDDRAKEQLARLDRQIASLDAEMAGPIPSVDAAQTRWQQSLTLNPQQVDPQQIDSQQFDPPQSFRPLTGAVATHDADTAITTIMGQLPGDVVWQTLRLRLPTGKKPNAAAPTIDVAIRIDDRWMPVPIESAIVDHQQTEPATAWFHVPGLIGDGKSAAVRLRLHDQTQPIEPSRLALSDLPPQLPDHLRIQTQPPRRIGPFPLTTATSAYYTPIVDTHTDDALQYAGQTFRWQSAANLTPVQTHDLPSLTDRDSETVIRQTITSPIDATAELLIDAAGGLIVTIGDREIYRHRGEDHRFDPLSRRIKLPLVAGENHLQLRSIDHGTGHRIAYAIRSIAMAPPRHLATSGDPVRRQYFRRVVCVDPAWTTLTAVRDAAARSRDDLIDAQPTTLVWKELTTPRPAHVLIRGQYDTPGPIVPRSTPSFLPPMPDGAPPNRLGLAMWLTADDHPLTARVAVNRFWQMIFGTGLVRTAEDFGNRGEPPSHPELLDALAANFRADWDVKRLLRSMVLSRAYRRSAAMTPETVRLDPDNRYLARGPRHRLDAEVIRDQALAIGGLLQPSRGGPSVRPPQPAGLWSAVGYTDSDTARFIPDRGDDVYRRSVYTFWKRTSAPPTMATFDAPPRLSCTARRQRTNTPAQALVLLNEPQFIEAAKGLAARAAELGPSLSEADRADWMFQTVTARPPTAPERSTMTQLLRDTADYYQHHPTLADHLTAADPQTAARIILATTLLNLDTIINN